MPGGQACRTTIAEAAPREAAELPEGFDDEEFPKRAESLALSWMYQDVGEATSFVAGIADEQVRSDVAAELGHELVTYDHQRAMDAYLLIPDPDRREAEMHEFIAGFAADNFEAARAFVRSADIDAETRASLEAAIDGVGPGG